MGREGAAEDEMTGWHHWLDGHESEWTPGVGDGQGGLACCDSWGCRVGHDWATELNWTELRSVFPLLGSAFYMLYVLIRILEFQWLYSLYQVEIYVFFPFINILYQFVSY